MAINTAAQLAASSSAVYTTNGANAITAALVRPFNDNFISSSVLIPMTSSMTVLSSSYAFTASSATSAGTASYATSFKISGSFIVTGSAQSNVVSQSVASSTASIDSRAGNTFFIQLPASSTTFFNFTNLLEGQTGNIIVSGSSAGTASFSSNVKQVSGSGYNNSTVGGIDLLSFTTWNNNVYLVNSKRFV
jgi:hypothetical protein